MKVDGENNYYDNIDSSITPRDEENSENTDRAPDQMNPSSPGIKTQSMDKTEDDIVQGSQGRQIIVIEGLSEEAEAEVRPPIKSGSSGNRESRYRLNNETQAAI